MYPSLSTQRERYLLLTLAGVQFSHILDFMIMMPLGPMLMSAFGIGTHEFGLLVASYSFSSALSGLLGATLIDRFERKRLTLYLIGLFGLAALACGLAPSYSSLLVARGVAGVFGGVIGAMVQTMLADLIPFERRAKATGVVSTAFSIATVAGVPASLWLATHFGWRAPFFLIAALTIIFIAAGLRVLPELRHHIDANKPDHPFSAMFAVLRDGNHVRALFFSGLVIFSGFTIIPYLTVYAIGNVGISQSEIPVIYLFGGAATLISARLIGHWADKRGKVEVYRYVACGAMLPILAVTQMPAVPLWIWLVCTTGFFVLVSGRTIPAVTVIAAAAQPKLRGTFMSLNSTVQSVAMGLATMIGGYLITQNGAGTIDGYPRVGYVALAANLIAIVYVSRVVCRDRHAVATAPVAPLP